jgi:hypothetical protein
MCLEGLPPLQVFGIIGQELFLQKFGLADAHKESDNLEPCC